ncbi:hypothetical protein K9L16_03630 [Candidatus Pacearchaeota archaeon]|nr:hypothetical protein [Candidatus Pacearchaeota archaeon]
MIPIPREKILRRIEKFKRTPKSEFPKDWEDIFIYNKECGELSYYSKCPFFKLEEVLANPSELFLSNNGYLTIGLNINEVGDLLEIKKEKYNRIGTGKTEYSFIKIINSNYLNIKFIENFFNLPSETFLCKIVEPAYGLRVDSKGQLRNLLKTAFNRKVPLFINTIDLKKKTGDKRAYVVNGFDI